MFSSAALPTRQSVSRGEVAAWVAVVAVIQWFTGLGILIAIALAFTRLRHNRPVIRWGLVVLTVLIFGIQIVGLQATGDPTVHVSRPHRVN